MSSYLSIKTVTPANISHETKILCAVQAVVAGKAALANPRQFLAAATVAILIGIAHGIFELKKHQKAYKDGDFTTEVNVVNNLHPLPSRTTTGVALLIFVAKLAKVREIQPRFLNWTQLAALPLGYKMGTFVAREVGSRFVANITEQQKLIAGLSRAEL